MGFDVCAQSPRLGFHCSFYLDNCNIVNWGGKRTSSPFDMLTSSLNLLGGIFSALFSMVLCMGK